MPGRHGGVHAMAGQRKGSRAYPHAGCELVSLHHLVFPVFDADLETTGAVVDLQAAKPRPVVSYAAIQRRNTNHPFGWFWLSP